MKFTVKKSVTGFFLFYFLLGSLVFLGQDLTVRKTTDSTWCISLANHNLHAWWHHSPNAGSLKNPGDHCQHKHHPGEIHLCVEHHKFLLSGNSVELPRNDLHESPALTITDSRDFEPIHLSNSYFYSGHDPGPPFPSLDSSSILLL